MFGSNPPCGRARLRSRATLVVLAAAGWLGAVAPPAGASLISPTVKTTWVSMRSLATAYEMKLAVAEDVVTLSSKSTTIRFYPKKSRAEINGTVVWLNMPLAECAGGGAICQTDKSKIFDPILTPRSYLSGLRGKVVVLDPGHGGDDVGAISRHQLYEKNLTLDLAKRVRTKLANAGLRAYLTRENDRTLELEERGARARRFGADLFVSLHLNSGEGATAYGIETYALTPFGYSSTQPSSRMMSTSWPGNKFDSASAVLSYRIHHSLRKATGATDRGVRRARFLVLREAPCPAALVECGFLSHAKTEALLQTSWYLDRIAQGIADGIVDYAKLTGPPPKAP